MTNNQEHKPGHRPATFVIAEMACSHEGDPALARAIVDGAGAAGADAIQFQIWQLANNLVPQYPDYQRIARLELSQEQWTSLAEYVRTRYPRMQIIACVQDHPSIDFARHIADAFKLHSSDLSNPPVVKHVAQTGLRIDLSVGASTIAEIQTAVQWIREASASEIWMMYGIQRFPTPSHAIHLRHMMKLKDLFEVRVGYQDHCAGGSEAGFWLPAATIGMGVDILEKHITHDRSKKGVDHEAALNPDEFARFTEMVREIDAALGVGASRPFSEDEEQYRKYCKKSLVAACELPAGTPVREEHLRAMRAVDLGLPPDQTNRLVGRTTVREIAAYQLVGEGDVK